MKNEQKQRYKKEAIKRMKALVAHSRYDPSSASKKNTSNQRKAKTFLKEVIL